MSSILVRIDFEDLPLFCELSLSYDLKCTLLELLDDQAERALRAKDSDMAIRKLVLITQLCRTSPTVYGESFQHLASLSRLHTLGYGVNQSRLGAFVRFVRGLFPVQLQIGIDEADLPKLVSKLKQRSDYALEHGQLDRVEEINVLFASMRKQGLRPEFRQA